jgi:leucyl-tRNA synthetase
MMFAAPPEQSLEWSDSAVEGAHRFLRRLWKQVHDHLQHGLPVNSLTVSDLSDEQTELRRKVHETIQKVSDDTERRQTFNTAIAAIMELSNAIGRFHDVSPQGRAVMHEALETAVLLLSPIVPHICHQLWQHLGHEQAVIEATWPLVDEAALTRSTVEIVVQVNGKVRARIEVAADADEDTLLHLALAEENVQKHMQGKTLRKKIAVPNKLLNIVVG